MQDPVFVKDAFAKIAGRYMLTNHVLSLGLTTSNHGMRNLTPGRIFEGDLA
jgi:ubiquinone/menaquinone biosynthesis C-methylase UbiE